MKGMNFMYIVGLLVIGFFLFIIAQAEFSGVIGGTAAIFVIWKLLSLSERRRQRRRCLENAMQFVYKIKYMHSVDAKKRCADLARDNLVEAIALGYKPEKDDRWIKVQQYLDEVERMDEASD